MSKIKTIKTEKALLISGIVLRIVYFVINLFIGGYHIDEVMTKLNAVSLAERMTDITREKLPVYFDTWVTGGQSPLATYISALTVKLFGNNLFGVRIPMLIISIIGLIAFYGFIKEIFSDEKRRSIFIGIACVSPWAIFSGIYLLDCNYLAYMLVIAFYSLAKAINTKKCSLYVVSSVFFALGFYCYIASVLVIPPILLGVYLTLLIKKKIGFKELALSVVTVFAVALPFILFGLVVLKVIPEFKLFGFSFSAMPDYKRVSSVSLCSGSIADVLASMFVSGLFLTVPDIMSEAIGANIFHYANSFGGIFAVIGMIKLAKSIKKDKSSLTFNQKLFGLASFIGVFAFCVLTSDMKLAYAYRLGVLTFFLLYLEGLGIAEVLRNVKKVNSKRIISVFLALTLAVFSFEFFAYYIPRIDNNSEIMYGDPVYDCLDFAEEKGAYRIALYDDNKIYTSDISVYFRDYYYDSDRDFINLKDELTQRLIEKKDVQPTTDSSIIIVNSKKQKTPSEDFVIVRTKNLKKINVPDSYEIKNFGDITVLYK